jgi:hypothetical protein
MTTTSFAGQTCTQIAAAYMAAKSPSTKASIADYVRAKASRDGAFKRWVRLSKAIAEGDNARIAYYAAASSEERAQRATQIKRDPKPAKATPMAAHTDGRIRDAKGRYVKPKAAPKAAKADPLSTLDALDRDQLLAIIRKLAGS